MFLHRSRPLLLQSSSGTIRAFSGSSRNLRQDIQNRKPSEPRARRREPILPSKPSTYYDPSNDSLDFTKSNQRLLDEILKDSKRRTFLRKAKPAKNWLSLHENPKHLYAETNRLVQEATVSLETASTPLGVGDLVLLNGKSTILHLVVAVPSHLSSDIYRFISGEGELVYGTRHHVKLRIPRVLSKQWVDQLRIVALEHKHLGIAPIGMPDTVFSRSKLALPWPMQKQLKNKKNEEFKDNSDSSNGHDKITESSDDASEASSTLSNTADDFIVAQAASQLLTDTDVKTYIVPATARDLLAKSMADVSIAAFDEITEYSNKLEYFHKVFQYDEGNQLIRSSRTFPFFQLFGLIRKFPGSRKRTDYQQVNAEVRNLGDSKVFGTALTSESAAKAALSSVPVSSYIAFVVALNRMSRLWKLNLQKSTKAPLSVDVIPVAKTDTLQKALDYLKGSGIEQFSAQYVKFTKSGEKPGPNFQLVVQMLKDFVAGNVSQDNALESLSGSLIRSIDEKLRQAGLKTRQIPFANEYSRARAYEILMALENGADVNPIAWDESLALPGAGGSHEADIFSEYYGFLDHKLCQGTDLQELAKEGTAVAKQLQNDFYLHDPMASVREDFGDTPVYCIDSATAHEIDDGISISDSGSHYEITVHVANPSSYLKPTSSVCQVAFQKGTTVYLPERAVAMLPQFVSKLCGLNGDIPTRTLGIQYRLTKSTVDEFLQQAGNNDSAKPDNATAEAVLSDIRESAEVRFFTVRNFPKDQTYENVNKTLNDSKLQKQFSENELPADSHARNLFLLYHISKILRHARISVNEGFEINSERSRVKVEAKSKGAKVKKTGAVATEHGWSVQLPKSQIVIERDAHQHHESKSQQLVSNFMIAGNYAGSLFAQKNKVPIIRRTQRMALSKKVKRAVTKLNSRVYKTSAQLSMEEMSQILSVMVAANDEVSLRPHETLGLDQYSKFTSPLRRFVDMVNHWQMQGHILGKKKSEEEETEKIGGRGQVTDLGVMSGAQLVPVASHLQSCEHTSKRAQRFSDQFWTGRFLKQIFENGAATLEFAFLLRSDAKYGDVRADLLAKDPKGHWMSFAINTTIAKNDYVSDKFAAGEYAVGQVVENEAFRVAHLDYIESELVVQIGQ